MAYQTKFSKDEIKSIGIRMHASRVLTGLSREEFAEKQNIPVMSIKNWELGRVMPRTEGIQTLINAFKEQNIYVSFEWILYGSGVGPNYIETTTFEREESANANLFEQVSLFKKSQRAQGLNPVVVAINDDNMSPTYFKGDLIGGIILPTEAVKKEISESAYLKGPWMISVATGEFVPALIYFTANQWLMNTFKEPELKECGVPSIAKIKWHYRL
jgi:transcriptional regulator with XRE-family HTH domain